jgi:hypothetical protein
LTIYFIFEVVVTFLLKLKNFVNVHNDMYIPVIYVVSRAWCDITILAFLYALSRDIEYLHARILHQ